jgi:hypothetical protein
MAVPRLAASLLPANPYAFAALVGGATMLIHMVLGSALACMSIVAPPMVHYAGATSMNPLVPALLVYTAVAIHYLLPFQHVTILLGQGEVGGCSARHVLRYGLPLTLGGAGGDRAGGGGVVAAGGVVVGEAAANALLESGQMTGTIVPSMPALLGGPTARWLHHIKVSLWDFVADFSELQSPC